MQEWLVIGVLNPRVYLLIYRALHLLLLGAAHCIAALLLYVVEQQRVVPAPLRLDLHAQFLPSGELHMHQVRVRVYVLAVRLLLRLDGLINVPHLHQRLLALLLVKNDHPQHITVLVEHGEKDVGVNRKLHVRDRHEEDRGEVGALLRFFIGDLTAV